MAPIVKTHFALRIIILICLVAALPGGMAFAASGDTTRVSVSSGGTQGNDMSRWSQISGDGNYVAFESYASNLVSGDTNGEPDIFVYNRQTGVTERVSVASDGSQANNWSESDLAISNDGRYVAFASMASNLVSGDTNGVMDVFVRDRQLGTTRRVSVDSNGAQVSGDEWTSYGGIAISGDGRFVTFTSEISTLVSDDTNGVADAFVHDLQTGATIRISISSSGEQGNDSSNSFDISDDGHLVVFGSRATNLVSADTNGATDIFVHNLLTGETTRVSVSSSGQQADHSAGEGVISADGRYVAFSSEAENLVPNWEIWGHVYIHDLQTGETTRASVWQDGYPMVGWAGNPSISGDGRYVAFEWDDKADGMAVGFIYVHDRVTGQTVSVTKSGLAEEDETPFNPSLSGDGHFLVYDSGVATLVSGDTNGVRDVFLLEDPTFVDPAPRVLSLTRADANPTGAASVRFTVTFSEAVTGVDSTDFELVLGGFVTGAAITNVSGSGATYTVTVSTGTGTGGLGLNLIDDESIVDARLQPLAGNGSFMGEGYTIDKSVPSVTGILRADPNPTYTSRSVRFAVYFSEAVTGVDKTDFKLVKSGTSTAAITSVSGSGTDYTVTVSTGATKVNLRLDLIDNDTIRDVLNQPLGGAGLGNGNFTAGQTYNVVVLTTTLFRSNGTNDGWVVESGEDTNLGGSLNATATTFYLGDNAQDRQFRAFLHFPTSTLPDNAVILNATLKLRKQSVTGTDPFATHQNVLVDIRSGAFSNSNALQIGDFQAPASRDTVAALLNNPSNNWYSTTLDTAAFPYINKLGITQFRLAFQLDDNDDLGADTIQFYSGNYGDLAYRPQLQIQYYVP